MSSEKEPTFSSEMPALEAIEGVTDIHEARTAPEQELANCVIDPKLGAVVFDPFATEEKEKSIEDQMAKIELLLETNKITPQQALNAMENVYRVNHSVGRDILYDRRLKPKNRARRYIAYAIANGVHKTVDEAEAFAARELSKQHKLAGNWGTVTKKTDIRD